MSEPPVKTYHIGCGAIVYPILALLLGILTGIIYISIR